MLCSCVDKSVYSLPKCASPRPLLLSQPRRLWPLRYVALLLLTPALSPNPQHQLPPPTTFLNCLPSPFKAPCTHIILSRPKSCERTVALRIFQALNDSSPDDALWGATSPPFYPSPWIDADGDWAQAHAKAQEFVKQLTLLEKVNLTTGVGYAPISPEYLLRPAADRLKVGREAPVLATLVPFRAWASTLCACKTRPLVSALVRNILPRPRATTV